MSECLNHARNALLLMAFASLFSLAFSNVAHAESSLSPAFATAGEIVTIVGTGFGDSPGRYGALCFGSTSSCYVYPSSAITNWSDASISFVVPSFAPSDGTLLVYKTITERVCYNNLGTCRVYDKQLLSDSIPYSFRPYVERITNEAGANISGAKAGDTITIHGYLFGAIGRVQFGEFKGSVISWDSRQIKVIAPEASGSANSLSVINSLSVGSNPFTFDLYSSPSRDTYSHLQKSLWAVRAPGAWAKAPHLGSGVVVAVIDTGVNVNHPDFLGHLWTNEREVRSNGLDDDGNGYIDDYFGYNFISNVGDPSDVAGHGSQVAGIIAASKDNNSGIAGIAPKAQVMSLVACNSKGCDKEALKKAIIYAADNGARVVNISIGGLGSVNDFDSSLDSAISYAYDKGMVIVVAAGNGDYYSTAGVAAYGRFLNSFPNSPVCNDGGRNMVIGVASIDEKGQKSTFSDYGSACIDVAAPGEKIVSISHPALSASGGDTDFGTGTSFAAPHVAGAVALLLGEKSELSNWEVAAYLKGSGTNINSGQSSSAIGHVGVMLHVDALLSYMSPQLPDIELAGAQVRDGKLFLSGTSYVNRDTLLIIAYANAAGEEKIFQASPFDGTGGIAPISIKNIPPSSGDYKLYLQRSGGRNKSPVITLSKDMFSGPQFDASLGQSSVITLAPGSARPERLSSPRKLAVEKKNSFVTISWKRPVKSSGMGVSYEYVYAKDTLTSDQLEKIVPQSHRTTRLRLRQSFLANHGIRYVYVRALVSKKNHSAYVVVHIP